MENECNEKWEYLHQQWRHLFRAIAFERRLGTRSPGGIRTQQPHRPGLFEFEVGCWADQRFRWPLTISFHNPNPARRSLFWAYKDRLGRIFSFGCLNVGPSADQSSTIARKICGEKDYCKILYIPSLRTSENICTRFTTIHIILHRTPHQYPFID